MFGYVKRIAIGGMLIGLVGCASVGLENPTAAELQAARCQDAQMAYNLSIVMLDPILQAAPQSAETVAYWEAYKRGAALGLITYCGKKE